MSLLLLGLFAVLSVCMLTNKDESVLKEEDSCNLDELKEELKRAQEEIEKQAILFSIIQKDVHGAFIFTSIDGDVLTWSSGCASMWDVPPESFEGGNIVEIFEMFKLFCLHNEWSGTIFLDILNSDELSEYFLLTKPDKKVIELYTIPVHHKGVYYGRLWKFRELKNILSGQYLFDVAIKDHELIHILEDIGEGFWCWNVESGSFVVDAKFAAHFFDLPPRQFFDEFVALHLDTMESCISVINDISKGIARMNFEFEFQIWGSDEMWHWILARGIATKVDECGLPTVFTGIFVDISSHKQYEMSLTQASHKVKILSQITRHDISNQLTALFSLHDALLDIVEAPETLHILSMCDRSLQAIKHLIDFTREYQEIGVNGAVWQDINYHLSRIHEMLLASRVPSVTLHVMKCPRIFADPLLGSVLYNLVENSLRHGEYVTEITVSFCALEDNSGLLIIEDNGAGVEPAIKEKIFENGFGKNSGFGLFLVHEILSITHISIKECGEYGRGARFQMHIPSNGWKWVD